MKLLFVEFALRDVTIGNTQLEVLESSTGLDLVRRLDAADVPSTVLDHFLQQVGFHLLVGLLSEERFDYVFGNLSFVKAKLFVELVLKYAQLSVLLKNGFENVDLAHSYDFESLSLDYHWMNNTVNQVGHLSSLMQVPFAFQYFEDWLVAIVYEKIAVVLLKVLFDDIQESDHKSVN